ncbi:MAG: hypothetical protein UU32_C0025G0006 [Candidatus Woesebacteria bacterium GW2011_GWB1_41_10]|uniref:Uncharacterized protein n=1 Tax=Candidatus Woesebacteria bacterium GW2011_GWB1_41_10 TaxID=1618577 RepID=A0A0G0UAF6_9BACT|nr:MAG: hypothetical protein UU32_C0025G0006 [Candidatus Woesebacteria bacterium GW2011_GWB1_41_10]
MAEFYQNLDNTTLESIVRAEREDARIAFAELSGRALGADQGAMEAVLTLDNDISSGMVTLPPEPEEQPRRLFFNGIRRLVKSVQEHTVASDPKIPGPDREF